MKLLIDGRVLQHKKISGVERYVLELLNALDRSGVRYDLNRPSSGNRYGQHLWEHTALAFRARKYDLLFSPGNIAPLWKPRGTKFVTTIHDLSFWYFPEPYSKMFRAYYSLVIPRIIKISDAVLTLSEDERGKMIERFPYAREKIHIVRGCLNEKFLQCLPHPEKDPAILFVGSLNWRKNYHGAIAAFCRIMDRIPHRLVIVGGSNQIFKEDLRVKGLLAKIPSEKIEFKGYLDESELFELYRRASLFVFPSFYEGFGFPPLEAMACGCPVIASRTPSLMEVCGDAAYYVDPYDVEGIAEGIFRVLSDEGLRESLICKGLERARFFSGERSVSALLRIFDEALGGKNSGGKQPRGEIFPPP